MPSPLARPRSSRGKKGCTMTLLGAGDTSLALLVAASVRPTPHFSVPAWEDWRRVPLQVSRASDCRSADWLLFPATTEAEERPGGRVSATWFRGLPRFSEDGPHTVCAVCDSSAAELSLPRSSRAQTSNFGKRANEAENLTVDEVTAIASNLAGAPWHQAGCLGLSPLAPIPRISSL